MKGSRFSVTGERLRLISPEPEHAVRAFELLGANPEIFDHMSWGGPQDLASMEESYADWCRDAMVGSDLILVLVDRETGEFLGGLGIHGWGSFRPMLGYWVRQDQWGMGIATEAVGLALKEVFSSSEAGLVMAEVFEGNPASGKVLEHNGLRIDPSFEPKQLPEGDRQGHRKRMVYCITRAEYQRRGD